MPTDLCGGTQTFWRSWGDTAPEVLMIHCTLAHSGAWKGMAEALGRPAVAFDLPSHGRSAGWDQSQDLQSQSLAVARDFLNGPMDVIGHSFGATVALRMALETPELVRSLVLIEPVLFAAARGTALFDEHMERMGPMDAAFRVGDMERAAKLFTAVWGTGVAWDDLRVEQRTALTDQIPLVRAQDAALFKDAFGILDPGRLEALPCPVLIVQGGDSPPIIGAINAALADRIPNASTLSVPGGTHMVPITHPVDVATKVHEFYAKIRQPCT